MGRGRKRYTDLSDAKGASVVHRSVLAGLIFPLLWAQLCLVVQKIWLSRLFTLRQPSHLQGGRSVGFPSPPRDGFGFLCYFLSLAK